MRLNSSYFYTLRENPNDEESVSGQLLIRGGYIKKSYVGLLEPFGKSMGENKARQLLDTLETFALDAGMNSSKTGTTPKYI